MTNAIASHNYSQTTEKSVYSLFLLIILKGTLIECTNCGYANVDLQYCDLLITISINNLCTQKEQNNGHTSCR